MANDAKIALLAAYTLARAQRYGEAEGLILSEPEVAKTPEGMDLLARIRLEKNDIPEARRLWQEILTIHPEFTAAHKALKSLGKSPIQIPWKMVAILFPPMTLAMGLVIGAILREPKKPAVFQWEHIPTSVELEQLRPYYNKAKQVRIASRFFSDPKRLGQRAVLTELFANALGVQQHDIFIADAPGDFSPEAMRVVVEQQ